jgi:hypothetical protein
LLLVGVGGTLLLRGFVAVIDRAPPLPGDRRISSAAAARRRGVAGGLLPAVFLSADAGSSVWAAVLAGVAISLSAILWVQLALLVRWQRRAGKRVVRGFGPGLMWGEHFTVSGTVA